MFHPEMRVVLKGQARVAFFVAANSALKRAPVSAGLLVLGDMSVQGQLKPSVFGGARCG